jgi:AcrR family transcriptional regulator
MSGARDSQEREIGQNSGSVGGPGVLTPSIPWDIAARSQRERILRAMARSCAEKTFAATTIADIVGHASISRATFYKHFANKTECFYAAAESFLAELQSAAEDARILAGNAHPQEVREVMAAVLERLATKPDQAKLLLVEAANVDPEIVRRYRGLVLDALEAELRSSEGRPFTGADPEIAFGRAKVLIADYVAGGQIKRLPTLLPELVYIALLPYVGQDAALEQAQIGQ